MGLTTRADALEGKVKNSGVMVAKNYLSQDEMKQLNRMVTAYLDFAETEFEKYRVIQHRLFISDFNKYILQLEENAKR